jgi:hypothetical protein
MNVHLTEENFRLFAAKCYDNPSCMGMREFEADLRRFRYLTRLFNKYLKRGKISDRLVINHLVVLRNVFGDGMLPMTFFRIEEQHWSALKTFLVFLNFLPDHYRVRSGLDESEIPLDKPLVDLLRKKT